MGICLFCNLPEENYRPPKGTDYVCSQCVQTLLKFDQDELKFGYDLAIKKGFIGKASAIKSFIGTEEDIYESTKTRKARSNMVGKRTVRTSRSARYQIGT